MKAARLLCRRVVVAVDAFVEVVVWQVPEPVPPSTHGFKYRLAYVVGGQCALGSTPDQLMADFETDVARWNHEHGRS